MSRASVNSKFAVIVDVKGRIVVEATDVGVMA